MKEFNTFRKSIIDEKIKTLKVLHSVFKRIEQRKKSISCNKRTKDNVKSQ